MAYEKRKKEALRQRRPRTDLESLLIRRRTKCKKNATPLCRRDVVRGRCRALVGDAGEGSAPFRVASQARHASSHFACQVITSGEAAQYTAYKLPTGTRRAVGWLL